MTWDQMWVKRGANESILKFITTLRNHKGEYDSYIIRDLFACGYCYYFAEMLKTAFPGGKVCICYPFGHIVYWYDYTVYDIDGISIAEFDHLIPVEFIGDALDDFKHIEGKGHKTTKEEIAEIGVRWEQTGNYIPAPAYPYLYKLTKSLCKNILCFTSEEQEREFYLSFKETLIGEAKREFIRAINDTIINEWD